MAYLERALYAGTFDPITFGHLDIIQRAIRLVDHLIIAIAKQSAQKEILFPLEERVRMVQKEVSTLKNIDNKTIDIQVFSTLLMDFAVQMKVQAIIRGLRAISDFEYEFPMATMNARLNSDIETVFLMASESNHFISSRLVKEIAFFGGDTTHFVSFNVSQNLKRRLQTRVSKEKLTDTKT